MDIDKLKQAALLAEKKIVVAKRPNFAYIGISDYSPWVAAQDRRLIEAQQEKDLRILEPAIRADERELIGAFLEESKETFHAVYRDSEGEQTYTIARHALDKIIHTLKNGAPLGQALKEGRELLDKVGEPEGKAE